MFVSNRFYKCYGGRAYLMDCPAGLWWYPEKDSCSVKQGTCKLHVPDSSSSSEEEADAEVEHPIEEKEEAEKPQKPAIDDFIVRRHPKHPKIIVKTSNTLSECPATDDPWNPVHLPHPFECDKVSIFFLSCPHKHTNIQCGKKTNGLNFFFYYYAILVFHMCWR